MPKQTLLYSLTLNGQKTYLLAALDSPTVGMNLLRPSHWESYVSDVFQLTNPQEVVTLFNIQNTYDQYDPETGLAVPTGLNAYNISSSDTASIILRKAIATRSENNNYHFKYIMSRSSYRALLLHDIMSKLFLIISFNKSFLNLIKFRAWDRFTKTLSLGLSLLHESPITKAIKLGVKFARKVVTPRILKIAFFAKMSLAFSRLAPLSGLGLFFYGNEAGARRAFENDGFRANFPLATAAGKFFISCCLYQYVFAPLLNFLLTSPMIPQVIQIAAPALIASALNVVIAFIVSYYAAQLAMRVLSTASMMLPGAAVPVDRNLAIEASVINRHYSSWKNWFFAPTSKDIHYRLTHLDADVTRPYVMSFIFNNPVSRVVSDFIFRRLLGYSNQYQPVVMELIARAQPQERPRLVVLPVNLVYGEQGLIKTLERIPRNDLKPCLLWSAPAGGENVAPHREVLEFNDLALMNDHLRRQGR